MHDYSAEIRRYEEKYAIIDRQMELKKAKIAKKILALKEKQNG